MTNIMTFSSTESVAMPGMEIKPQVWKVVSSLASNSEMVGTGSITSFVISSRFQHFNFDLAKMSSRVECEEILMPANMNSVDELDAWLMGLNLE